VKLLGPLQRPPALQSAPAVCRRAAQHPLIARPPRCRLEGRRQAFQDPNQQLARRCGKQELAVGSQLHQPERQLLADKHAEPAVALPQAPDVRQGSDCRRHATAP